MRVPGRLGGLEVGLSPCRSPGRPMRHLSPVSDQGEVEKLPFHNKNLLYFKKGTLFKFSPPLSKVNLNISEHKNFFITNAEGPKKVPSSYADAVKKMVKLS